MSDAEKILKAIIKHPGRKARQIAESLGLTRREVNAVIYGQLGSTVYHDTSFRWWPRTQLAELPLNNKVRLTASEWKQKRKEVANLLASSLIRRNST